MIFLAIIKTIIDSITNITYKQALAYHPRAVVHASIWHFIKLIIVIGLLIFLPILSQINLELVLFVLWSCLFAFFAWIISQTCYRNEKISALVPYSKADSIMVIIYSYFFLNSDNSVSFASFIIALITIFFIVFMNIDFNNFTFSKYTGLYLVVKFLRMIWAIFLWYAIIQTNPEVIYALEKMTYVVISIVSVIVLWIKFSDYKLPAWYYKLKMFNEILWIFTGLAWLFIIKKLWLVISTMLWFLWFVWVMFFAYVLDWDKPSKKNFITWIIVMTLVSLWYYLK
jgi:hypothetical protein